METPSDTTDKSLEPRYMDIIELGSSGSEKDIDKEHTSEKCDKSLGAVDENPANPYLAISNQSILLFLRELGLRLVEDDHIKWRKDAAAHPRNWSASRKFFDVGLVLLLDLFTLVFPNPHNGTLVLISMQDGSEHCRGESSGIRNAIRILTTNSRSLQWPR
jgi:hypothetical protein